MEDHNVLFLSNEPLKHTETSIMLDLRGIDTSRSANGGSWESDFDYDETGLLEGQILFDPAQIRLFSIAPGSDATLPFSFAPDPQRWDLYLMIVPFSLPGSTNATYSYKMLLFSLTVSNDTLEILDLFPREILSDEDGKKGYTVSVHGRFQETENALFNIGKQLRFAPLRPKISAFESGKQRFSWIYQGRDAEENIEAETKYALTIFRAPRGAALISGKIMCQTLLQKTRFGVKFKRTARTKDCPFQHSLVNLPPFRAEPPASHVETPTGSSPSFDVSLICALPKEANAVKHVLEEYFDTPVQSLSQAQYKRRYYQTQLKTATGFLSMQINWLADVGPDETILQVKDTLAQFHPRFIGMTGICAGNRRKVALGDLIIARHAFPYGASKIMLDEQGQTFSESRVKTRSAPREVIQAAINFEGWKSRAQQIKRPISRRQQRAWLLHRLETTGCSIKDIPRAELASSAPLWEEIVDQLSSGPQVFLKPDGTLREGLILPPLYRDPAFSQAYTGSVASDNKVRADDPFARSYLANLASPDPHTTILDAIAIDMEGAAFYRALEEEHIPFLFVKGVSDYADTEKDDSFHNYAATLSALFMVSFLLSFMSEQPAHAAT